LDSDPSWEFESDVKIARFSKAQKLAITKVHTFGSEHQMCKHFFVQKITCEFWIVWKPEKLEEALAEDSAWRNRKGNIGIEKQMIYQIIGKPRHIANHRRIYKEYDDVFYKEYKESQ